MAEVTYKGKTFEVDEDGFLLFTGRKKRKAAEAAPAEPEPAVTAAETPAVEAAAVPDAPPEDECSGKGGGEA